MIEIAGKTFRNLQEQVAWLTAMINQATDVVKHIEGKVASSTLLPSAATFSNGTTYAVGAASPYEYYVAINGQWLNIGTFPEAGPAGSDGRNGKSIFITSQSTTSGTTVITAASVYNPGNLPIGAGNLILSEQGDIFAVTGTNSLPGYNVVYRCNIMGPQGIQGVPGVPGQPGQSGGPGPQGEPGSLFYYGTQLTYDSLGLQVEATLAEVPLRVGDFYLITSDYTESGHDFHLGDVYVCTAVSSFTADLSYAANIRGPQGPGVPIVTAADAGKFAVVDQSGNWAAVTINQWIGGFY